MSLINCTSGDIVKIPQNSVMYSSFGNFFIPDKPIYGILVEEVPDNKCIVLINNQYFSVESEQVYKGI